MDIATLEKNIGGSAPPVKPCRLVETLKTKDKDYDKKYYQLNKERIKLRQKEYDTLHKAERLEKYQRNKDKLKAERDDFKEYKLWKYLNVLETKVSSKTFL